MSEIIDVFDGNHQKIGSLDRQAVHSQGLWHQTFHCWIFGHDHANGFVIFQLRSKEKKNYPNMLDITAAGHLTSGEGPIDGVRELQEELGVDIDSNSLISLGVKHDVADEGNGTRNREFAHVFLLRDDRALTQYVLQADEVSGLVRMSLYDGLRLFSGEITTARCASVRVSDGTMHEFEREVSVKDLIPRVDSYYLKVFMLAKMALAGEKYLAI